jgi:hypothetical protein
MNTNTQERLRFIAQNYETLQGLRFAPVSLGAVLVTLIGELDLFAPEIRLIVMIAIAGLMFAGMALVSRYYRTQYGSFEPRLQPSAALVTLTIFLFGSIAFDLFTDFPFALFPLATAAFSGWTWRRSGGLLPHYVIVAAIFAIVFALSFVVPVLREVWVNMIVFNAVLLVCALLDHRVLVRETYPVTLQADSRS